MSAALILFSITLLLMAKATEKLKMKHIIFFTLALTTLAVGIAAMAFFLYPVGLGALTITAMGLALLPFTLTLYLISKVAKNIKMKDIKMVNDAMWELGCGIAKMALLLIPIALGAPAATAMSIALWPFTLSLYLISKVAKKVKMKDIKMVNDAMWELGCGIAKMSLLLIPIALGAPAATAMNLALWPFTLSLYLISKSTKKIKMKQINFVNAAMWELGCGIAKMSLLLIPITLGAPALTAMNLALWPFVKILKMINNLKRIPMNKIHQVLKAMKVIGNFFKSNSLSLKTIWQARRYKRMMRPFGKTIEYLEKLKKVGRIPMSLVHQTLKAIDTIVSYYQSKKLGFLGAIKARASAAMISGILSSFGGAVNSLSILKKMGRIPTSLVRQSLKIIDEIVNFYNNKKLGFFEAIKANISASMITGIVESFGEAVETFKSLKGLRRVPTEAVKSIIIAISNITWFYSNVRFGGHIKLKSILTEYVVNMFIIMATKIQDKFAKIKEINYKAVLSITYACHAIINFYTYTFFFPKKEKIIEMNASITSFADTAEYLKNKTQGFSKNNYNNVMNALKAMYQITLFLKYNTLNKKQRIRAHKNISILSRMATAMSKLSLINS
jgi:hypothetical protein